MLLAVLLRGLLACTPERAGGVDSGLPAPPAADTGTGAEPEVERLPVQLGFPLPERSLFETLVGVDHDPVEQEDGVLGRTVCVDYFGRGFPHCYDQHDGSDYILHGGFDQMDAGSAEVVAAMDGVVLEAVDGNYDRCHGDLSTGDVSCDGYDMVANSVTLQHEGTDGGTWRTKYWHLKQGSVLVQAGQAVVRGQQLGLVGSSGYSSMPHLHFELQREVAGSALPLTIDPYAGPYSQAATGWCDQGDEEDLPGDCTAG